MFYDTIAAISTPQGRGGIGIVRISGTRAIEIADGAFLRTSRNKDLGGSRQGNVAAAGSEPRSCGKTKEAGVREAAGRNAPQSCSGKTPLHSAQCTLHSVPNSSASPDCLSLTPNTSLHSSPSHTIHYGRVVAADGATIDEVLATVMRAPKTFTGEDTVELNCHGGIDNLRMVLERCIECGARLANPGEFTQRAFLNGKIDLAQAEAVIDMINAKTGGAVQASAAQMGGGLSARITQIRGALALLSARMLVVVDYPDEDIDEMLPRDLSHGISEAVADIDRLLATFRTGAILKDGLKTVIVGAPNVGKSSLLNALLHDERAIVTDIAGTTRDTIEEMIQINGVPLRIIDTAGIRQSSDVVEQIGIARSREALATADLALVVLDKTRPLNGQDAEVLAAVADVPHILVWNKVDQELGFRAKELGAPRETGIGDQELGAPREQDSENRRQELREAAEETESGKREAGDAQQISGKGIPLHTAHCTLHSVAISAKLGTGIDELLSMIYDMFLKSATVDVREGTVLTNVRHFQALVHARAALERAAAALADGIPPDMASIDIALAMGSLGEITGVAVSQEIVDRIFADFCVGK